MSRAETDAAGLWTRDVPDELLPKPARDGCRWETCSSWRSTRARIGTKPLSPRLNRTGSAYKRALAEERREQAERKAAEAARVAKMRAEARAEALAAANDRAAAELATRALEAATEELRVEARLRELRCGPGELAQGGVPTARVGVGTAYHRLAWALVQKQQTRLLLSSVARRVALMVPFVWRSISWVQMQRYAVTVDALHDKAMPHIQTVQERVGAPQGSKAPGISESDLRDLIHLDQPTRSMKTLAHSVCILLDIEPPMKQREVDPELEILSSGELNWWLGLMNAVKHGEQFIKQVQVIAACIRFHHMLPVSMLTKAILATAQEFDCQKNFDFDKARVLKPLLAQVGSPEALKRTSHALMVSDRLIIVHSCNHILVLTYIANKSSLITGCT